MERLLFFSGDPIVASGGNIVFDSDKDAQGNRTGICTGGGVFSGIDAIVAPDVHTINISGAILTLSGSANLSSRPISVLSSLVINAQGNINTNTIGAGSAIILTTSGGSINTGTLSAGSFVQLQAPSGTVNSGAISSSNGAIIHAQDIHIPSIAANGQIGFVDIKSQTSSQFIIGSGSDPLAQPNIGFITMIGTSPSGRAFINIDNPNGVLLRSTSAITINTSNTVTGLSFNAQNGTVTLPAGTISLDSAQQNVQAGNFAVSANQIVADGLTINARNTAGGPGGIIFLGATTIDRGSGGLTLNTDGGSNLSFAGIGLGGKQSVQITTEINPPFVLRNVNYSGSTAAPFELKGSGTLTATSNGTLSGGSIFVDSDSTATFSGGNMSFSANGTGANGFGGFVQLTNRAIINSSAGITLSANGNGGGTGGFVEAVAYGATSDLTLGPGKIMISATGGPRFGSLLNAGAVAGRNVTIEGGASGAPAAINADAGSSDTGGIVEVVSGLAGPGNTTILGSISANGGNTGGTITLSHRTTSTSVAGLILDGGKVDANGSEKGGTITVRNRDASGPLQVQEFALSRLSTTATNAEGQMGRIILKQPGRLVSLASNGEVTGRIIAEGSTVNLSNTLRDSVLTIETAKASLSSVTITNTGINGRIDVIPSAEPTPSISAPNSINLKAYKLNIGIADDASAALPGTGGSNGALVAHDVVLQTDPLSLDSGTGDIRVATDVNASNTDGTVTVSAHGAGNVLSYGGRLSGHQVSLSSGTGTIGPGNASGRDDLLVWTDVLSVNTGLGTTQGNIFVKQEDSNNPTATRDLSLQTSYAGNQFFLDSRGSILIDGNVRASILDVNTTIGNIGLNSALVEGFSSVTLHAGVTGGGTGTIIQLLPTAVIKAPSVQLGARLGNVGSAAQNIVIELVPSGGDTPALQIDPLASTRNAFLKQIGSLDVTVDESTVTEIFSLQTPSSIKQGSGSFIQGQDVRLISTGGGHIGTSENENAIKVLANRLTANTSGEGDVFIRNERSALLTIDSLQAGRTAFVHSTSDMNVAQASGDNITLRITDGQLTVLPFASILANADLSAVITLRVDNATENSRILIGTGASILAVSPISSAVNIYMGPTEGLAFNFSPLLWSNVTFDRQLGGEIVFGLGGIDAQPETNTLRSLGLSVINLNTTSQPGSHLVLGGSTLIQAIAIAPGLSIFPTWLVGPKPVGQRVPAPGKTEDFNPGVGGALPPPQNTIDFTPPGVSVPPPPLTVPTFPGNASPPGIPLRGPSGVPGTLIQGALDAEDDENVYVPVAFVSPAIRSEAMLQRHHTDAFRVYCTTNTRSGMANDRLKLEYGKLVVYANRRTLVKLGHLRVTLAPNSVVEFCRSDNSTMVRCLHETGRNRILLELGNNHFSLTSGQELQLLEKGARHSGDGIARRSPKWSWLSEGRKILHCEFSYSNTMSAPIFKLLSRSPSKEDKQLYRLIEKTAGCMTLITQNHGRFSE